MWTVMFIYVCKNGMRSQIGIDQAISIYNYTDKNQHFLAEVNTLISHHVDVGTLGRK